MVSGKSPPPPPPLVKFPRSEFPLQKFPRGNFSLGKLPWKTPFLKLFLLKKCFSSEISDFLFPREININIYNRLYLFISKIYYLSDITFIRHININKMHSNTDSDLIKLVVCKCWYCHWDLFCNWYQQWSVHFDARFSNYLK